MDNRIKGEINLNFYHEVDKDDTETMKIVGDFVWRIISAEDAKVLCTETNIDVYTLFEDGTESLIEIHESESIDWNDPDAVYGVEVGHIKLKLEQPPTIETVTITIEQ